MFVFVLPCGCVVFVFADQYDWNSACCASEAKETPLGVWSHAVLTPEYNSTDKPLIDNSKPKMYDYRSLCVLMNECVYNEDMMTESGGR